MRYFVLIFFLVFPHFVFAACTEAGATVVYVNGVFTTRSIAEEDLSRVRDKYRKYTNNYEIQFINGYNPSHLAGLGDIVTATAQILDASVSIYDRNSILLQIHPEVTTRRLLLVGHSQGTFYVNEMYEYLLNHGEPREAVGVYSVATPTYATAGEGHYLNSTTDSLLNFVEEASGIYIPRNTTLPLTFAERAGPWPGHSLSGSYLASAPERVADDSGARLAELKPTFPSETGECFSAPDVGLVQALQKGLFALADPTAVGIKKAATASYQLALEAARRVAGLFMERIAKDQGAAGALGGG